MIGLLLGLAAVVVGQMLEGGNPGSLVQPTAFIIVIGGTLGAVMLQSPAAVFQRGMQLSRWVWSPPPVNRKGLTDQLLNWSQVSRREGLLALERFAGMQRDPFVKKGLQLLIDGAEPDRLRDVLEVEIAIYEDSLRQGAKVWESAGGYSPTIGILGAVMGLIHVMENLTDPSKLGAGIATAFVATIYGVGFANLVLLPAANKIKAHIGNLVQTREMIVDGLVGIANGDNPRLIESRLRSYQ